MPEPTKTVPTRIVISPDDPDRSRSWPDPRQLDDVAWRATHAPASITRTDLLQLVSVVSAYGYIFSISQREFLPTHAAIRAALAGDLPQPTPIDEGETDRHDH